MASAIPGTILADPQDLQWEGPDWLGLERVLLAGYEGLELECIRLAERIAFVTDSMHEDRGSQPKPAGWPGVWKVLRNASDYPEVALALVFGVPPPAIESHTACADGIDRGGIDSRRTTAQLDWFTCLPSALAFGS